MTQFDENNIVVLKESDCKENYFKCSPELKEALGKFNRIFIDTNLAQNLVLNEDGSLTLNENLYADKSAEEKEYIQLILKSTSKTAPDIKHLEDVYVKDWKVWFTYVEVRDTFAAAVSVGPAAVIAALQVIGTMFPGVGNAVMAVVGAFGGTAICVSIAYSLAHKKGWWIGIDGWLPGCGAWG